jgi:hypothetical protein
MKTHLIFTLIGAILGIVAASFIVPPALTWYASPGGLPGGANMQVIAKVPDLMKYATSKLLFGQTVGAIVGALAFLILSLVIASKRGTKGIEKAAA